MGGLEEPLGVLYSAVTEVKPNCYIPFHNPSVPHFLIVFWFQTYEEFALVLKIFASVLYSVL